MALGTILRWEAKDASNPVEVENEFNSLLPGFYNFPTTEKPQEEKEVEIFYLWDTNVEVWEIYRILRNYTNKDHEINAPILLKLVEHKYNAIELLEKIPTLHYSYCNKVDAYTSSKSKELPNG